MWNEQTEIEHWIKNWTFVFDIPRCICNKDMFIILNYNDLWENSDTFNFNSHYFEYSIHFIISGFDVFDNFDWT